MPTPEIINMFAVPFSFSRYPNHERLNPALKRYILASEKDAASANPRPLTQRNAAVFESHFNLFRDADASIQELKTFCWDQLLAVIGMLNLNAFGHRNLVRVQPRRASGPINPTSDKNAASGANPATWTS